MKRIQHPKRISTGRPPVEISQARRDRNAALRIARHTAFSWYYRPPENDEEESLMREAWARYETLRGTP